MKTLVIVDLQYDFVPGGALAVPEGDATVAIANQIMPTFDLVVATQDWHPADHGSFAANHPGKQIGNVIDLNGQSQILWPTHCVQNTHGAELLSSLDASRIDKIIQKGTDPAIDSYSGFFDNGHRKSTGLGDYLSSKKASQIYVMGLATDYCVKFTALDAVSLGFETYLIEDGCRGVNLRPDDSKNAVEEMKKAGVVILQSKSV